MGAFDKMQSGLEKMMGPIARVLSGNRFIKAITAGMMAAMPITLGVVVFAILGNLPIEVWQRFIVSTGLYQHVQDLIAATSSMLAIYISFTIAYHYAANQGEKGITAGIMSMAAFICFNAAID